MSDFNCPNCNSQIDTTDWFDCFNHNGDVFEMRCNDCLSYFEVRALVEVAYEVVGYES